MPTRSGSAVATLADDIVACRACPRLVAHRERVAASRCPRFRAETYWGRPVPGFGDPAARILVVGLAPAAHGANRTGRMFTGDRSGDFLFAALHACGLANQPESHHAGDGLRLQDVWITAIARCAPPQNRPTPDEMERCRSFLCREIEMLRDLRVVVALGHVALTGFLKAWQAAGRAVPRPRPVFGHGRTAQLAGAVTLVGCYHPSQQNTFTGRLTMPMLQDVLHRAAEMARGG